MTKSFRTLWQVGYIHRRQIFYTEGISTTVQRYGKCFNMFYDLLRFQIVMKQPVLIHSHHILQNSTSPSSQNHVCNLLCMATRCSICSDVSKSGTHLHGTRHICESTYKIANTLLTEMFKRCASSQTVILWFCRMIDVGRAYGDARMPKLTPQTLHLLPGIASPGLRRNKGGLLVW